MPTGVHASSWQFGYWSFPGLFSKALQGTSKHQCSSYNYTMAHHPCCITEVLICQVMDSVKFNHKWLLLQDWYHVQSSSPDNSCPSCQQQPETPAHFLACTHHEWTHIWKELHDQLQQYQIKNNISNIFYNLMAYELYQGQQARHNINLHHVPQCNANQIAMYMSYLFAVVSQGWMGLLTSSQRMWSNTPWLSQ